MLAFNMVSFMTQITPCRILHYKIMETTFTSAGINIGERNKKKINSQN